MKTGITTASLGVARYRDAAANALRQAVAYRSSAARRTGAFDRYLDRAVMRTFALEWRFYLARAAELAPREQTAAA